jgi:DNA replication protein DnaC
MDTFWRTWVDPEGKVYSEPCSCWPARRERMRAEWIASQCGLPKGLRRRTLASFDPGRSIRAKEALSAVQQWLDGDGWLLLRGPYGAGKTHLAAAAVGALVERGQHAVYGYVPDLLDSLRQVIERNDQEFLTFFHALRDVPWLVLDDLGVERTTEWVEERLTQIFNHRADHELPLLVTTNARLEDLPPRIAARLRRLATKVVLA